MDAENSLHKSGVADPLNTCILCEHKEFDVIAPPPALGGVSSDIKPYPRSFPLWVCRACGHVQKSITPDWLTLTAEIYAQYDIYHLAGGAEQVVFQDDAAQARSARLLGRLLETAPQPPQGALLDVGCGNGAMLRSAAQLLPGWQLFGQEINDHFRADVESIPGVEKLLVGDVTEIDGTFDLITLLHVLEHIADPVGFLTRLGEKLNPGGLLLIQVPAFMDNPYDLLVADHASHFTPATLTHLAARAGLGAVAPAEYWIAKEISLLLQKAKEKPLVPQVEATRQAVEKRIAWLRGLAEHARQIAANQPFGIFGTATGGTWLGGILQPAFFVDEDALKAGGYHLQCPIYLPENAPSGGVVYLALAPAVAKSVYNRLQPRYPALKFIQPPELD